MIWFRHFRISPSRGIFPLSAYTFGAMFPQLELQLTLELGPLSVYLTHTIM